MATVYTGYQPRTFTTQTNPYGRFISGFAADDGDLDDAAHLMALAMAAMDRTNFLAWRTINIIDGDTATLRADVTIDTNGHTWKFAGTGATAIDPAHTFGMLGVMQVGDGGNPAHGMIRLGYALIGAGHLEVYAGSDITVKPDGSIILAGTSGHNAAMAFNGFSVAAFASGSTLAMLSGAAATFANTPQFTNAPTKNADPGANNVLTGPNIIKAWAHITTNGSGGVTVDDGYNISSVSIAIATIANITFVRPMLNANYAVHVSPGGSNAYLAGWTAKTTGNVGVGLGTSTGATYDVDFQTTAISFTVTVVARQ